MWSESYFDADSLWYDSTPVLLAVDEAQALFMRSNYRSPQFDLLESYALSLPRLLLDYVSGRKSFDRGAVLTAISLSTPQHAPPKEIYAAIPELANAPVVTPYDKVDAHHVEAAKGLEVFSVGDRLDLQEARGILDLCQHRKFVFGGESGWRSLRGRSCHTCSDAYLHCSHGRDLVGQIRRVGWKCQRVCTWITILVDGIVEKGDDCNETKACHIEIEIRA